MVEKLPPHPISSQDGDVWKVELGFHHRDSVISRAQITVDCKVTKEVECSLPLEFLVLNLQTVKFTLSDVHFCEF